MLIKHREVLYQNATKLLWRTFHYEISGKRRLGIAIKGSKNVPES